MTEEQKALPKWILIVSGMKRYYLSVKNKNGNKYHRDNYPRMLAGKSF